MNSSNNFDALMKDVARAVQADARRRNILPEVERRLAGLDAARDRRGRAARWTFAWVGAAACAGAVAFALWRPQPLSYSVGGLASPGPRAGLVGDRLVGPAAGPLQLRFSDGSEVTVPPRAQARVDALDARGATVVVEEGTVEVSVVHRDRTRWEVRAGRYHVRVTGTRFAAGWNARTQSFTVTMHEGSVEVTGPGLAQPMRVVTGQRLRAQPDPADRLQGQAPLVSIEDAAAPEPIAEPSPHADEGKPHEVVEAARVASAPEPQPVARASAAARARRGQPAAPQAVARTEADWRALAGRSQYRDALAAALRDGWSGELDRLDVEGVSLLGDVARLAGDIPHAEEAYRVARRRFPGADRPIYALGLVAFEGRHDYAAAAGLFDAYLTQFPRGPLVREAAGRLIEARLKAGDTGAARAAAAGYLGRFPDGPHAALARRTVAAP